MCFFLWYTLPCICSSVLHSNVLRADTYSTHMSGAPSRSSLRDVAGASEKGMIRCWWGLAPLQESCGCHWPHAKLWSLRRAGGLPSIPSLSAGSISESYISSVAKTHFTNMCWVWKDVLAAVAPAPIVLEQVVVCGVCITVPALRGTAGSSFPLPSVWPFLPHLHLRNRGTEVLRERFCKLFQTILLFEDVA